MEKERFAGHGGGGGGLPPPFGGRLPSFPSPSPVKLEISPPPGSSSGQPEFSNDLDLGAMLDFPPRNRGHRRAHSEILGLPDDISFDSDLGIVGEPGEGPSLSDEADDDLLSMYMDMEKLGEPSPSPANERPRVRHQHSQSMDGSTSVKAELLAGAGSEGPSMVDAKKAMSAAKLSELALIDPKRAKRIWANRQSAARSKERKIRYIAELERKVQTLQTEATTLSAQLTLLQRDTTGLTSENSELKLRLQTMEQQVHLQDALNDALREEVQCLKLATGQAIPKGGLMNSYGSQLGGATQQYYSHNNAMQTMLAAHQLQQLQLHAQQPSQSQQQLQHQHPTSHSLHLLPNQLQLQQQANETWMKGGPVMSPNPKESTANGSSSSTKE